MTLSTTPRSSGPGCFGYGCLIATVLFCIVIGSVWFFGLRSIRSAVDLYTASTFAPFAPIVVSSEVEASVAAKLGELQAAANEGRSVSVEFSEQEAQAIIESTPWKNWLRVGFAGEELTLAFSFPLSALGEWTAASRLVGNISERALVGTARCTFRLISRTPNLNFSALMLNGHILEDLPRGHAREWVIGAVAQALQEQGSGLTLPKVLREIQDVQVRDGKLGIGLGAGGRVNTK